MESAHKALLTALCKGLWNSNRAHTCSASSLGPAHLFFFHLQKTCPPFYISFAIGSFLGLYRGSPPCGCRLVWGMAQVAWPKSGRIHSDVTFQLRSSGETRMISGWAARFTWEPAGHIAQGPQLYHRDAAARRMEPDKCLLEHSLAA